MRVSQRGQFNEKESVPSTNCLSFHLKTMPLLFGPHYLILDGKIAEGIELPVPTLGGGLKS
jgi:hypothetical protein